MPVSILHVGLPLDHPAIPPGDAPAIRKRLDNIEASMRTAGYRYQIAHISPNGGLEDLRNLLKTQPCDGVLIGGGVAGDPALSFFMEQIIDATHQLAPHAKIMFYNHSTPVIEVVRRWFPSPSA